MIDVQYILALDPGGTTGWCTGVLDDGTLTLNPNEEKLSPADLFSELQECVDEFNPNFHIIYEDFSYRAYSRSGLDLTPVKLIGIIEAFREWYEPLTSFTKQSASTGKSFYTDEKLKELGIYVKGKKHGRDAMRHLLQWYAFGPGGQFHDIHQTVLELA